MDNATGDNATGDNAIGVRLRDILLRHGHELLEDPRWCDNVLRENFPGAKREVTALITAVKERVPQRLLAMPAASVTATTIRNSAAQVTEETGLKEEAAQWAIEAWVVALGLSFKRNEVPGNNRLRQDTSSVPAKGIENTAKPALKDRTSNQPLRENKRTVEPTMGWLLILQGAAGCAAMILLIAAITEDWRYYAYLAPDLLLQHLLAVFGLAACLFGFSLVFAGYKSIRTPAFVCLSITGPALLISVVLLPGSYQAMITGFYGPLQVPTFLGLLIYGAAGVWAVRALRTNTQGKQN